MKFSVDQGNMLPFPESLPICSDFKVANGRPRKKLRKTNISYDNVIITYELKNFKFSCSVSISLQLNLTLKVNQN